ncbi:MAG: 5-(carboxyamino)imidazole ribonucleotide synthase [Anaerolineae bacterium]|nr:5-(carboxyamino)imidazole ribonucleotide synthase [Gemmatimonadaceae bacterium]
MHPILPGATIGIFGGGQLGRMTAMAARSFGYGIRVLDPDPTAAARPLADDSIVADFNDVVAAATLARACDVVTLEIEKVALASLQAAALYAPVRPGAGVLDVVQDRGRQKAWLTQHGFPVGPYRLASSTESLGEAVVALGDSFAKSCTGGYDGRGQVRLASTAEAKTAWVWLGEKPCVVEQALDLEAELSVLIARRPGGDLVVYPTAFNHHEERILAWSVIPAPISATLATRAQEIGRGIAEQLGVEGLLAVELFLTRDGSLLVNELAPRPHNSFHATERACITSQFEQAVRAVCDLPLGAVDVVRPAAIINLLGDLWQEDRAPNFARALRDSAVRLHLYGKRDARLGRKMGHLSATGTTPQEAVERVQVAKAALTAGG